MAWLIAAHRGPTVAMVSISSLFAVLVRAPLLLTALAVLAGQLSVGWQNDLLDRERDQRAGRVAKPLVNGALSAQQLQVAWPLAAAAAVIFSFPAFGMTGGMAHIAAVLSAWSYNVWFKRTVFSFLPYVISFALLPCAIVWGANKTPSLWLALAGGAIGIAIHVINVWPDIDEDLATGVRGLPQRLVAFARDCSSTADRSLGARFALWLRRRT